jgi:hypothetical protein
MTRYLYCVIVLMFYISNVKIYRVKYKFDAETESELDVVVDEIVEGLGLNFNCLTYII